MMVLFSLFMIPQMYSSIALFFFGEMILQLFNV